MKSTEVQNPRCMIIILYQYAYTEIGHASYGSSTPSLVHAVILRGSALRLHVVVSFLAPTRATQSAGNVLDKAGGYVVDNNWVYTSGAALCVERRKPRVSQNNY